MTDVAPPTGTPSDSKPNAHVYTIRGLRTSRGMEGEAYSGNLFRDGVKVGEFQNSGDGGDIRWDWVSKAEEEAFEAQARVAEPESDWGAAGIYLESVIENLERAKWIAKMVKKGFTEFYEVHKTQNEIFQVAFPNAVSAVKSLKDEKCLRYYPLKADGTRGTPVIKVNVPTGDEQHRLDMKALKESQAKAKVEAEARAADLARTPLPPGGEALRNMLRQNADRFYVSEFRQYASKMISEWILRDAKTMVDLAERIHARQFTNPSFHDRTGCDAIHESIHGLVSALTTTLYRMSDECPDASYAYTEIQKVRNALEMAQLNLAASLGVTAPPVEA